MQGDGEFRWYWGATDAPETFHGPFDTADLARATAASARPQGDYSVVEADRPVADAHIFSADEIMARFEERNAFCWDGEGFNVALTSFEKDELTAKLGDCFARWLRKHALDRGTMLHQIRAKDYFGPVAPTTALEGASN